MPVIIITTLFTACDKDDDGPRLAGGSSGTTNNIVTATLNGKNVVCSEIQAFISFENTLIISGVVDTLKNETFRILLPENTPEGQYPQPADFPLVRMSYTEGTDNFNINNGEILITFHDTLNNIVVGEFSFSATSVAPRTLSVSASNGRFSINYEQ